MKKIIPLILIASLIACGKPTASDNPENVLTETPTTAMAVVQRFLSPEPWANMGDYLAPYLSSVTSTLGQSFAENGADGTFSYRVQQQDDEQAYIAVEYRSVEDRYNIYFELGRQDDFWRIYSVLGLPQSEEAQMDYYSTQQLLMSDKDVKESLASSFLEGPLLFNLNQHIQNMEYIVALDSDLIKMMKKNYSKTMALIKSAEKQDAQVVFAFKNSDNMDIAQKLANLSYIAIDSASKDDLSGEKPSTILVSRSLENMLFLLHQTDESKVPPLGGNIAMVEKVGKNLFLIKSISAYESPMMLDDGHYEGDGHQH